MHEDPPKPVTEKRAKVLIKTHLSQLSGHKNATFYSLEMGNFDKELPVRAQGRRFPKCQILF